MKRERGQLRTALLATVAVIAGVTHAHPVSQVAATANIAPASIRLRLEVKTEDLVWFHLPDATNAVTIPTTRLRAAARKHQAILAAGFQIIADGGQRLLAGPPIIELEQLGGGELPAPDLKSATVAFTFVYPLKHRPAYLTFLQEFGGSAPPVPCSLELTVLRDGKWIEKPVNLDAGTPHSVHFDWNTRPPGSLAEIRHQNEVRKRERLGIAHFGDLHSFIHIGPTNLRHELVLPFHDLAQWIKIAPGDPRSITVADQRATREQTASFFRSNCPVIVNGVTSVPDLINLQFHGLDAIDFGSPSPPRPLHPLQARVAITLNYPAIGPDRIIRMEWTRFSKRLPFVRSLVFVKGKAPRHTYFTEQRTVFETRDQAPATAMSPLSFLFDDLCKKLTAAGDEVQLIRLHQPNPGEIENASLLTIQALGDMTFRVRWQTEGVSEHWGHRHRLEREHTALAVVRDKRIRQLQFIDKRTLNEETTLLEVDAATFIRAR